MVINYTCIILYQCAQRYINCNIQYNWLIFEFESNKWSYNKVTEYLKTNCAL